VSHRASPLLLFLVCVSDRVPYFCPKLALDLDPPISAWEVAGITGVC
jgi:hypothetical protein